MDMKERMRKAAQAAREFADEARKPPAAEEEGVPPEGEARGQGSAAQEAGQKARRKFEDAKRGSSRAAKDVRERTGRSSRAFMEEVRAPKPPPAGGAAPKGLPGRAWRAARVFLGDIKISHSVFALPFAVLTAFLVSGGWPAWQEFLLILAAMVTLRTFGLGFNRIADRHLDARNPRTAGRALPRGEGSMRAYWGILAVSLAVFVLCAWLLNPLALALTPVPVAVVMIYPYMKRFTWLCHLGVGAVFLIVPPATAIAIAGGLPETAALVGSVLMGIGAMLWAAGFDVVYTLNDLEHDREAGLHSMPVRFGVARALWITRFMHLFAVLFLAAAGIVLGGHIVYYSLGVAVMALLLLYQHRIVRPNDISKLRLAFFPANGLIAVAFGVIVSIGAVMGNTASYEARLALLDVEEERGSDGSYDREEYALASDWRPESGCNIRDNLLISQNMSDITLRVCPVQSNTQGVWESWYDGMTLEFAVNLEADHLVPLAEAHRSGGYDWSVSRRGRFGRDLGNLHLVTYSVNREKSDDDPAVWRPPSEEAHCRYAREWIDVKRRWGLSVDSAERDALREMLGTCPVV